MVSDLHNAFEVQAATKIWTLMSFTKKNDEILLSLGPHKFDVFKSALLSGLTSTYHFNLLGQTYKKISRECGIAWLLSIGYVVNNTANK